MKTLSEFNPGQSLTGGRTEEQFTPPKSARGSLINSQHFSQRASASAFSYITNNARGVLAFDSTFPAIARNASSVQRQWFKVSNDGASSAPAEMLIYDDIGRDYWSENGVAASDFAEALKAIPMSKEIVVGINSLGGNVWDGLAIYHLLKARGNKVTCRVDGIAASIASVIACAGKTVIPKNALFMMHDPSTVAAGNVAEMQSAITMLEKCKSVIAGVYQDKCGKPMAEIESAMSEETWMSGQDAFEFGLANEVTAEIAQPSNHITNLSRFKNVPINGATGAINHKNTSAKTGGAQSKNEMNRDKVIALLKKRGVTVDDKITDEALMALLETTMTGQSSDQAGAAAQSTARNAAAAAQADAAAQAAAAASAALLAEIGQIRAQYQSERKTRITAAVNQCVTEQRIPIAQVDVWVTRCLADETVLDSIRALTPVATSTDSIRIECISEAPSDLAKHFMSRDMVKPQSASARANFFKKNEAKLIAAVTNAAASGTNTVATELKRSVILPVVLRAFAKQVVALRAFSTIFANIPLEGTDKIEVPYYPLTSDTSKDYADNTGYVFDKDTTTDKREITVNKRKFQPMAFTSSFFRRQPYFDATRLLGIKAEKLGYDVFQDALSVITNANFGGACFTGAAAGFDTDDLADIGGTLDTANWPQGGRNLFLNSAFNVNLKKDTAVKLALNVGGTEVIRDGMVPAKVAGFDYYPMINLPANAENLGGFVGHPSAILFASCPIQPADAVAKLLSVYEVIVDADTGIAFEYKVWGDTTFDQQNEVVECNYGYAKGQDEALKRIVTA